MTEALIDFTDDAASKVSALIQEDGNRNLKLRIYVSGGGCSGFEYNFAFDEVVNEDDTVIEKNAVALLVDAVSFHIWQAHPSTIRKDWKARALSSTTRMPPQPVAAAHRFLYDVNRRAVSLTHQTEILATILRTLSLRYAPPSPAGGRGLGRGRMPPLEQL